MRVLENERVLLRPVEPEDLRFLMELRWNNEITEYIIHDAISMKKQTEWYENVAKKGDLALTIIYKDPEMASIPKLVGGTGLYDINHRHQKATLRSTRILQQYQNKNIAFEALSLLLDYGFNTLNLKRIGADYFEENKSIALLLKKLGFKEEGVLRSFYFHQGKFKDVIQVGLLREEFVTDDGRG